MSLQAIKAVDFFPEFASAHESGSVMSRTKGLATNMRPPVIALPNGPPERLLYGSMVVTLEPDTGRYLIQRGSAHYRTSIINGAIRFIDWIKPGELPVRVMRHGVNYPAHLKEVIDAARAFADARTWKPGRW